MGNQIKFTPKKKDEPFSVGEEEYRALEIENIQLKNTNRKLISKLDKQKKLIKNLTLELKTIKDKQQNNSLDELQTNYKQLKNKYNDIKDELKKSRAEIAGLNKTLTEKTTEKSTEKSTENATGKASETIWRDSDNITEKKEIPEASNTTSRWNKLKSHLPDDIKNLRESKKSDEK